MEASKAPKLLLNVTSNSRKTVPTPKTAPSIPMYPILKKHDETLALGSVGFRIIEGAIFMVGAIYLLILVPLSREFVQAGAPDASYFQTLGALLLEAVDWINQMLAIVFSLGALMIYYLFYQSKLIPRWLSGWGLIGATLHLASGLLVMFGSLTEFSVLGIFWDLPIALQEMVLAVWLIVRGFNSSAIASPSAK